MALIAGTVLPDGTGTGLAKALFDVRLKRTLTYFGPVKPSALQVAQSMEAVAGQCNDDAAAFIGYLLANAVVTVNVTTSDGALQTSTAAGNPTNPPATNKTLTGTIG